MASDPHRSRSRGSRPETTALFVRIPTAAAEKLDRAAFELMTTKQELVGGLLARYVDPSSPQALSRLQGIGCGDGADPAPADSRRITVETQDDAIAVGRHSFRPTEAPEVLTISELAELLKVEQETLEALADAGRLPGRRVGEHWRFSRQAVLAWLGADDEEGD